MRKIFFIISFLMILNNVYAGEQTPAERPLLAIAEFSAANIDPNVEVGVREAITNYIVKANKYRIVERSALNKMMKEIRLSQTDLYDPNSAVKLGKLLAARGIIVGSIMKNAENIIIQARLVDLQSGKIIRSSKGETPYEENVSRVCAKIAYELINVPYSDDVVTEELFLDFPHWKQFLLGLNVGVGFARRLGRFEGYFDSDTISNEIKSVYQVSLKFMAFFNKASAFGLLFDTGFYLYRIHEGGVTIENYNPYTGVFYFNNVTLYLLYTTVAPIVRYRDFHLYVGPYIGFLLYAEGKISPYQRLGSPVVLLEVNNNKSLFRTPDVGLTAALGYTFKNLPNNTKLMLSVEFRMSLRGIYDLDKVKEALPGAISVETLRKVTIFSLFVNVSLMFGL